MLEKLFGGGIDTNSLVMDAPHPDSLLDTGAQDVIGRPLARVEGRLKTAGRATYAAEYDIPDLVHGYLVRATIGSGRMLGIDKDAVRSIPGVIDVLTDVPHFLRNSAQGGETKAPIQGTERIAYHGEIVAIVLATSFEAARDAAQRLPISYETAEGRYSFGAYREDTDKPPAGVMPPYVGTGDIDRAMADAAVTIDAVFTTPSQNSAAMEPHAVIAQWQDGVVTVHGAFQMLASERLQLADALHIKPEKVHLIARYVGGGFGSKLGISSECVAAAIASREIGRPVKCVMARQQVFDCTVRRSNTEQRIRLGASADGRLTAIGHNTLSTNLPDEGFFEPAGVATQFLYDADNIDITHDIVRLDWMLSGSMRAPGEAVGMLALECAMDELADKLDIDPIELRRRNEPARDPTAGTPFSSRQLIPCLDRGAEAFGWAERRPAGTDRRGEWLHGIGVAAAARTSPLKPSAAKIAIDGRGHATVETDMTDIGTGTYTILAQIAGEILGLPLADVTVKLGDTALPPAAGSGGSWGANSAGSSVYLAAEALRKQLAEKMGVAPDALTLKDGHAIADNRSVPIAELVGDGIEAMGKIAPGKQDKAYNQASYGAHFCEVAVNAVTAEVRVKRMLGVFACGRVLNERTARSQCLGGMTFGIGAALTEELVHDPRNGKIVNRDLGEYHVPVNADVPQMEVEFLTERDVHANPMHSKGLGELGISGAGAAIANAIANATGVRVRDFPLTLDKILAGMD